MPGNLSSQGPLLSHSNPPTSALSQLNGQFFFSALSQLNGQFFFFFFAFFPLFSSLVCKTGCNILLILFITLLILNLKIKKLKLFFRETKMKAKIFLMSEFLHIKIVLVFYILNFYSAISLLMII